jgi:spore maturation protein CgeB
MRILILNLDYPGFLSSLYSQHPGLDSAPYAEQLKVRVDSLFNVGDFYSRNLASLGHEAWDLHINNEILQGTWARENSLSGRTSTPNTGLKALRDKVREHRSNPVIRVIKPLLQPFASRLNGKQNLLTILAAQIRHYRPDVILNQSVQWVPDSFLSDFRPGVKLIVGQIASPLTPDKKLIDYDVMVSSLPNFVNRFRNQGLKAELVRLAFEDTILDKLPKPAQSVDISFVGTLSADHENRRALLETVGRSLNLGIWGRIDSSWAPDSPVRRYHRGDAYGKEMYKILQESRVTLNYHIDLAENYANNLRLFEATGVGTLLLTDSKCNLHELFEPGKEVAVYHTPDECVELARYYVDHESEREAIAKAGQRRTLRDHTYKHRMQELSTLFEHHLRLQTSGAASYSC